MSKILNRPLDIHTDKKHGVKVNNVIAINKDGIPVGHSAIAVSTNGTTAVNVFGTAGAPTALVVTSVISIAQDTTAGNITLKQAANTVVTVAKGTTSGGVVGGVTLAYTTYAKGDVCTVVSSSVGNSIVVITYNVA